MRCFKIFKYVQSARYVSYQLWTCLSLWEANRRYFKIMLQHVASSDQKQMSDLTGLPRINLPKLKFAQAEAPLRFFSFKTCHFLLHKHSGTTYYPHCWAEKMWENISSCPAYYRLLEKMGENRSSCSATVCLLSGATMWATKTCLLAQKQSFPFSLCLSCQSIFLCSVLAVGKNFARSANKCSPQSLSLSGTVP